MGERVYVRTRIVLFSVLMEEAKMGITGVSIIVRYPLDISEIILAIFLLSIVYFSLKETLWEEKDTVLNDLGS